MKYLSLKILILCILMPPILYIITIHYAIQKLYIENHLKSRYAAEIENSYMGDTRPLFDGSLGLKDEINKNINLYLQGKPLLRWGIKANVTVITKEGTILYPEVFEEKKDSLSSPMQVAENNYRIMKEDITVLVDLELEHNTLISNLILGFYILIFLLLLFYHYRRGTGRAMHKYQEKSMEIERLLELEKVHNNVLKLIEQDKEKLSSELEKMKNILKNEKNKATKNEDDLLQEIVILDEKIKQILSVKEEQKSEIEDLKEKIKRLEKVKQKDSRQADSVKKRFATLYKNISVHDRAVSGYLELEEDMRIKSEEVIHQLNDDSTLVTIKRKVFGKKNRETVLEVLFAYKGRLYFRKTDNRIEVLAIGTKNTQIRDLEFLDNL